MQKEIKLHVVLKKRGLKSKTGKTDQALSAISKQF